MTVKLGRKSLQFTVDEYLSDDVDLPRKLELVDGVIGPFSNRAKKALLANWGADAIIKLTGPEVWREAINAIESEPEK